MARHVSYCQPCRRAAFAAGFDADALAPKRTVREKIAALLPLPAFLKRRIAGHSGDDDGSAASVGGHAATLAQLSTAAASYAEPAMHWGKAVAKAAAVAAAVVGAGIAAHDTGLIGGGVPRDQRPAAIGRPASPVGRRLGRGAEHPPGRQRHDHRRLDGAPAKGSGEAAARAPDRRAAGPARARSPRPRRPASDPVKAATCTKLPSADDNPVTKTRASTLTKPGSRGVPVKTPDAAVDEVPKVEIPKVEVPQVQVPQVQVPPGVPDPGGVVSGATGAVNDATGDRDGRRQRGHRHRDGRRQRRDRHRLRNGERYGWRRDRRRRNPGRRLSEPTSDGGAFLEALTDSSLYSIGAYFCDRHPELVDDVLAESQDIEHDRARALGRSARARGSRRPSRPSSPGWRCATSRPWPERPGRLHPSGRGAAW